MRCHMYITAFGIHDESKEEGKDQESIQASTTPEPGYHLDKKGNIAYKTAKRPTFSQQVITRLQGTDKTE